MSSNSKGSNYLLKEKSPIPRVTVTVRLTYNQRDRFKEIAEEKGTNMGELASKIVVNWMEENG